MMSRFAVCLFLMAPAFCADWNPRLAADYLDARQKDWFAWPPANANAKPCVSCHTGLPYLLARPALRSALHESEATPFELGLLQSLKTRVDKRTPADLYPKHKEPHASEGAGVESIMAALLLSTEDARRGRLSAETEAALDRMWSLQTKAGGWNWFSLELDPWEMPDSAYYGAALAAVATGTTPQDYAKRPAIAAYVARLKAYLRQAEGKPLHHRMIALWASAKLPDLLSASTRKQWVAEAWSKQETDGGWTMESLGAWPRHESAPPQSGSNSYATALVTFAMQQAGVSPSHSNLNRARAWLRAHQNAERGYWDAGSMNKRYESGSMQESFMRDAATGFATLALLGSGEEAP
jgi:squalene-hopene/tetraprenyl-beta-curcumene cyclase